MSRAHELIERTRRLKLLKEFAGASGVTVPQARAVLKGNLGQATASTGYAQAHAPPHPKPQGFSPEAIAQTTHHFEVATDFEMGTGPSPPFFEDLGEESQAIVSYMEKYVVGRWAGGLRGTTLADRRAKYRKEKRHGGKNTMSRANQLLARVRTIRDQDRQLKMFRDPPSRQKSKGASSLLARLDRVKKGRSSLPTAPQGSLDDAHIFHTVESGTVAIGNTKPIKEILKAAGFKWFHREKFWWYPKSRGLKKSPIDLAKVRRKAGKIVDVGAGTGTR